RLVRSRHIPGFLQMNPRAPRERKDRCVARCDHRSRDVAPKSRALSRPIALSVLRARSGQSMRGVSVNTYQKSAPYAVSNKRPRRASRIWRKTPQPDAAIARSTIGRLLIRNSRQGGRGRAAARLIANELAPFVVWRTHTLRVPPSRVTWLLKE